MKNLSAQQRNKKIRQEALREQLSAQGHVQHVVDIAKKLKDPKCEINDIQRVKLAVDIHLALIKKYLPDLKAVEISGPGENGALTIEIVKYADNTTK